MAFPWQSSTNVHQGVRARLLLLSIILFYLCLINKCIHHEIAGMAEAHSLRKETTFEFCDLFCCNFIIQTHLLFFFSPLSSLFYLGIWECLTNPNLYCNMVWVFFGFFCSPSVMLTMSWHKCTLPTTQQSCAASSTSTAKPSHVTIIWVWSSSASPHCTRRTSRG